MTKDPYVYSAKVYDRLFESMNKGLRLAGLRLYRPKAGMNILDVGCGTGVHLELYQRYECNLFGLDSSGAMLEVARRRLGNTAKLELGNAAKMNYEANKFDLIICMLTVHEMNPEMRSATIQEMKRVMKTGGRMIFIDFNPGPVQTLEGWIPKIIITLSELAAGREHYRSYRHFMSHGGLDSLFETSGLKVEKKYVLAGGTFAACLVG